MRFQHYAVATLMSLAMLWAACDENPSGCEDAKISIEKQIDELCKGPNPDPAYANSPFCTCCVAHGYYSVENDCTCRALVFNTEVCYYAMDKQALPLVRDAIEYANSICNGRKASVPYLDAGTEQCKAAEPGSGGSGTTGSSSGTGGSGGATSSSSSSSSSGAAGGTGGGVGK